MCIFSVKISFLIPHLTKVSASWKKKDINLIEFLHTYTGSLCNTQNGQRGGGGLKDNYRDWIILIPNRGQVQLPILWTDSIILNLTETDGFEKLKTTKNGLRGC